MGSAQSANSNWGLRHQADMHWHSCAHTMFYLFGVWAEWICWEISQRQQRQVSPRIIKDKIMNACQQVSGWCTMSCTVFEYVGIFKCSWAIYLETQRKRCALIHDSPLLTLKPVPRIKVPNGSENIPGEKKKHQQSSFSCLINAGSSFALGCAFPFLPTAHTFVLVWDADAFM